MKEYRDLIEEYSAIREELIEYTEQFYDSMMYDIEGYIDMYDNGECFEIDSLKNQVESFRLILEGMKTIEYLFG